MTEAEITASLQQSVTPPPSVVDEVVPILPEEGTPNQAQDAPLIDLDELTQYKLHDFFGEQYRATDEIKRQQLSYIYQQVSKMIETQDYGFVVAKMRDLEQMMGIAHSQDRLYKMYQWLKLDSMRKSIDMQMGTLYG